MKHAQLSSLRRRSGELLSTSSAQTETLGERLGEILEPGDVIGLVGDLGAGKTCFVRGVARGTGVTDDGIVSSPTFTLINEYPGRVPLAHLDLYRLADVEELYDIGALEYYGSAFACLVEWFDRFAEAQPADEILEVTLRVTGDETRELVLVARGRRHEHLLARWVEVSSRRDDDGCEDNDRQENGRQQNGRHDNGATS